MEAEASSFETSEILATFLGSTPLLSDSWNLCRHANSAAPHGFLVNRIAGVAYVAFSGVQTVAGLDSDLTGCRNLVALDCDAAAGLFSELRCRGGEAEEEPVMVHAGMLNLFLSMFKYTDFQFQSPNASARIWLEFEKEEGGRRRRREGGRRRRRRSRTGGAIKIGLEAEAGLRCDDWLTSCDDSLSPLASVSLSRLCFSSPVFKTKKKKKRKKRKKKKKKKKKF